MSGTETGALTVHRTDDVGVYAARVGEFLRALPVEHSVLLSTATQHLRGQPSVGAGNRPVWLWVEESERVVAAAQVTPPHPAYLSTGPDGSARVLARALLSERPDLPGVGGLRAMATEFADEWQRGSGSGSTVALAAGLYAADSVSVPVAVPGMLRPARLDDSELLRQWVTAFFTEVAVTPSAGDLVGDRTRDGLLFVWERDGEVVSMAALTPAEGGVSRVQYVYTPPDRRRQGFAAACVAAVTARELAIPGRTCMLYADLDNPTATHVYQSIGYRLVGEAVDLRFVRA